MPFCPKCGCEYQDRVSVCEDCSADLVQEPPLEIPEDYLDVEWVELHTFPGTLYTQMAVEMLNREGIPSYSISHFAGTSLGVSGGGNFAGASATVYVLEPDQEQALSVLEPMIEELPGAFNDNYSDHDEDDE